MQEAALPQPKEEIGAVGRRVQTWLQRLNEFLDRVYYAPDIVEAFDDPDKLARYAYLFH